MVPVKRSENSAVSLLPRSFDSVMYDIGCTSSQSVSHSAKALHINLIIKDLLG